VTVAVVLGSRGMLGRALLERLAAEPDLQPRGADLPEVDLRDPALPDHPLLAGAGVIFNAAAWTDVDGAEADEAAATAVNGAGVARLAAAAEQAGAALVHVSTDFVFDGGATTPYRPTDPPRPLSAYGRSKRAGEQALAASSAAWLCVRTAWLFGPGGPNFVETMLRLAARDGRLRVVCDQTGAPTYTRDLADALLRLWRGGARGLLHCTNRGVATWHRFACEIVRQAGLRVPVEAVTTAEFPRPAPRPAWSVLDCAAAYALLGGPLRPWPEALAAYLEERDEETP
jgi:dTDP-4-dehydrorhamnose reductase